MDIFCNNEFNGESYESLFLPATLHICIRGENVIIIKQSIRTINERARAVSIGLPYEFFPKLTDDIFIRVLRTLAQLNPNWT